MPTATSSKTTPDLSALLGIAVEMEDASADDAAEMRGTRGRQEGQDIQALREVLRDAVKTNTAKVFKNVTNSKDKDTLIRKVRQAGKGAGSKGEDVKVGTSYNSKTHKLFWGPAEVIESIKAQASGKE